MLVGLIEVILYIWDFITYPVYALIQQPWKAVSRMERTRARIVTHQATEITIRAVPMVNKTRDEMKAYPEEINTMDRLFNFSRKKFGSKTCLGTREVLGETEEKQPDGKVFTKLQLGDYTWLTYLELNTKADHLGKGMREIGVKPRDKIVLYANTSAAWMTSAVAAFKHSLAVVTIYANLGVEGVEHGISQTAAKTVVVSQELLPTLLAVIPDCSSIKNVIIIPDHNASPIPPPTFRVTFYKISDVISLGSCSSISPSPPDPSDTAIIMYTSGSTGVPKGVVMTHKNLVQALSSLVPTVCEGLNPLRPNECYIAVLPLAHVLELLAENLMMMMGIPIGYSGVKTLTDTGTGVARGYQGDATVLKPTIVAVVPLVLDRIFKGMKTKVAARGPFFSQLIDLCYRYRLKWIKRGHDTPIMNRIIFNKFKAVLGGNVRFLMSGGAPLAPDAHDYCRTVLGVTLIQGYGLTETCATGCLPDASDLSTGRVGAPPQDVDIRLVNWDEGGYTVTDRQGPRGEIVIGGGHVAKEYYGMPEKTREEFFNDNGKRWFKTGDIGHMMSDGTIKIIDRKKDLVKLQCGEYVSLGKVESLLKIHTAVENICVCADSTKDHSVALVVPGQEYLDTLAAELKMEGLSRDALCHEDQVVDDMLKVFSKHGAAQRLKKFEIPKAVYLVSEPWTPESGLLTAAMKLKRKSLETAFSYEVSEMYFGNNNQVWSTKMNKNLQMTRNVTRV
eukprot:GFUD01031632.1.p1 GENE.GFUD01031632.1~~GFUD01031632.1.p1  ORF type:complete len:730 (+),score=165.17 GFUD01031632.1:69-2258(+)